MRLRQCLAVATLVVLGAALAAPTAAVATQDHQISLDEQDCREVATNRNPVRTDQLRLLVPDRYELVPGALPNSSRTLLNTYVCSSVSVDGLPMVAGGHKPTIVSIWSALIRARDGVPTTGAYVLTYATDNPVLYANLHQSGLPVGFAPDSAATIDTAGASTTLTFSVRGSVDYDLTATATEPTGAPVKSTATWYHDGPEGPVALVFHNTAAAPVTSAVSGDLTRFQPYASMALASLTPVNVSGFYIRGSWTSAVVPAE